MILLVVDDLIFLTKIQQTARLVGVPAEPVDPTKLQERIGQSSVSAVILDLNHRSGTALDLLRALRGDPGTSRLRVIGFVSHVQADLVAAARTAGCDQVLARSAFSAQLPELLRQLSGQDAAGHTST